MGEHNAPVSCAELHACDLRNDFASLLNVDIITDVDIENLHLISIVERRSLYNGAAEKHRLEVGYRSYCAGTSYLVIYAQKSGQCLLCLELVGHCPSRELCGIAKFLLILQFVDLDNYSVSSKRKCFTLCIPIVYEVFYFFYAAAHLSFVRNRKAPLRSRIQCLIVGVERQIFTKNVIKGALKASVCHLCAVNELK